MDTVVVSLGGSVLIPDEEDADHLSNLSSLLKDMSSEYRLFLVCGGGKVARYYITTGRDIGASEKELDELGIMTTRINAKLVSLSLGEQAIDTVPVTIKDAEKASEKGKIVVMGGTVPGHTTDAVSAMLAERVGAARIVNGTSVDAAFTADPKKVKDAKRLHTITHAELNQLVSHGMHRAGPSHVFDPLGASIAARKNIPIYIINGRNMDEMRAAVQGKKIKGTLVSD
ncbi:MAG TPA: UMP kinase [Methanomassiliicoccales archaeon]|jgi:uridylate kinase